MAADPYREPTKFGQFLMAKMEELELSQSELARRANIGQATISRAIFSPGIPLPSTLRSIAPVLDVDYDELLGRVGHRNATTETPPTPAVVKPAIIATASRLNQLLGPDSPLPDDEKKNLERIIEAVLLQYPQAKLSDRRPA